MVGWRDPILDIKSERTIGPGGSNMNSLLDWFARPETSMAFSSLSLALLVVTIYVARSN